MSDGNTAPTLIEIGTEILIYCDWDSVRAVEKGVAIQICLCEEACCRGTIYRGNL